MLPPHERSLVPPTATATIWTANPNQTIPYGNWSAPAIGVSVPSGHTLSLNWSADGNIDSFIFTETQYKNFQPMGLLSGYMAHGAGSQGNITASVQNGDTFYAVVRNQSALGSIKLYQASLSLISR